MEKSSNILIFYIPCPNQEVAHELSKKLLSKNLIACSNILQGSSLYEWEDALAEDKEVYLLAKTILQKEKDVEVFIQSAHPYDLPCIARWEARVNEAYYNWVKDSCDCAR